MWTVLVEPISKRFLSSGYNGSYSGEPHCIDDGCIMVDGHCQRAIHSEVNAVCQAAKHGIRIEGAHAYVYGQREDGEIKDVCRECAKVLKAANITVIVCKGE